MNNKTLVETIKSNYPNQSQISTKDISMVISENFPEISPNTISWKINQLKKEKLINQVGRGLYSFEFKEDFIPEISLKSKRVYNKIKPLCDCEISVWDTGMLSNILDRDISKLWIFITVPKDRIESLFDKTLDFSKSVFIQPNEEIFKRYMLPNSEAIMLTTLVSETPIEQHGDYYTTSLEALLVNSYIKSKPYLEPIGIDIDELFSKAFEKYNVNQSKLLRYASRRDKRKELENLIKKYI